MCFLSCFFFALETHFEIYFDMDIVYLKHIQFISTITEIWPIFIYSLYDWQIWMNHIKFISLFMLNYIIQMNEHFICNSNT